jgi:transposase-like protein
VSGKWKYLYREVDREGETVDFLLTARRDLAAARRFLERVINLHDVPEKITSLVQCVRTEHDDKPWDASVSENLECVGKRARFSQISIYSTTPL